MKHIFICTDGTWNTTDQTDRGVLSPSNVAKMARIINTNEHQLLFYDRGVGTNNFIDKISGGAFGHGLFDNVKQAYKFLVANYEIGDTINIFGFSRGAYTARCLAGLVTKVGILRKKYISDIDSTYHLYKNTKVEKNVLNEYAENFCHVSKDIQFLGVWDTVGALGIPLRSLNWLTSKRYKFLDTKLSPNIKNAYHAIALDEKRRPFEPTLWKVDDISDEQNVEQRWFAGVHSNIGGGYKDTGLSDIALDWMLSKLKGVIAKIALDEEFINNTVKPDHSGEIRETLSWSYPVSMIKPHIRTPLTPGVANEVIDESVANRIACKSCDYQPAYIKHQD